MTARAPRPTHAQLIARGRAAERADVIAQLRQAMASARAIGERNAKAGVETGIDIDLYLSRLAALISTIEAGCHEGLAE